MNVWVNRMIGYENYPEESEWFNNYETLKEWPPWFKNDDIARYPYRYTFNTSKHYSKVGPVYYESSDSLRSSGLIGPLKLL